MKNPWNEISTSRSLQFFGLILCCTNFLSIYFWRNLGSTTFNSEVLPVCWYFFETCAGLRFLFEDEKFTLILTFWGLLASISLICFYLEKIKWAWCSLLLATLLKYFILIQDFRLMGNYHYIVFIVTAFYLFVPDKKRSLQWVLVCCYFFSGILRLTPDWLSGRALNNLAFLNWKQLEFALVSILILELVISFGFLFRSAWIRWFTLASFVIFHIASYFWVGYFFPGMMLLVLLFYPLVWSNLDSNDQFVERQVGFLPAQKISLLCLFLFCAAQIFPLTFPGDPAVSGEARTFSLNMFDARVTCDEVVLLRYKSKVVEVQPRGRRMASRLRCDPQAVWSRLKSLCSEQEKDSSFIDLDYHWMGKRVTDSNWTTEIRIDQFCTKNPEFSMFTPNDWIIHR